MKFFKIKVKLVILKKKKLIKPKLLLEKLNKIDKPMESPTKKTDNIIMKMEIQIYKEEIKRIIVY